MAKKNQENLTAEIIETSCKLLICKLAHGGLNGLNIALAHLYSNISSKTLERDMDELLELEILIRENEYYFANISALNKMIVKRNCLLIRKD